MLNAFIDLDYFLKKLDSANIHYALNRFRDGFIAVEITVPGERWEVEFSENGTVEIEIFKSNGKIHSEEILEELFTRFSDEI